MHASKKLVFLTALLSTASALPLTERSSVSVVPDPFTGTISDPALLNEIELQAQGTPPNGGAPTLSKDDITSFQLIAFNEIFEVAYFSSLLYNVTNNVTGYEGDASGTFSTESVIEALTAIQAQEVLHATSANAILAANNIAPIVKCEYTFPVTTLADALALAKTFTSLVLGTLQNVQLHLANNGAAGVVPIIGSVIGQEGEQTGWFRASGGLIPSAQPFLTRAAREFAWSALNQLFVVPGSCPAASTAIDLPIFAPLSVTTTNIVLADQTLSFAVPAGKISSCKGLKLALISGQNIPVIEDITNVKQVGDMWTFDAAFPAKTDVMEGLTVAALITGDGTGLMTAGEVATVTVAGPGIIQIN